MNIIIFFITSFIAFGYAGLLFWIMKGWEETPEWEVPESYVPQTSITVIIAARNEENYIKNTIYSVLAQNFPEHLLQLIVVDDQSTDSTPAIVKEIKDHRLQMLTTGKNTGKKAAISLAVDTAKTDIVICTDADCIAPTDWLRLMVSMYEINRPKFLSGPIVYETDRSIVQRFQYLDGVANMAITAAGIHHGKFFMANGANMLFEKQVFYEVGGYDNEIIASGDDMMMVQKIANDYPDKVRFLKNAKAAVKTQPVGSIADLLMQRKRWATKSMHYADKGIIKVQAYIFLVVMALIVNTILIPFTGGFSLFSAVFLLFVKWAMDFLFLNKMADYFSNKKPLNSFFSASVWFIIYILWATKNALLPSKYTWKGRSVN